MGTSCDVSQAEDGGWSWHHKKNDVFHMTKSSVPIPTHCGRFIKHSAKQIQSRTCAIVMSVRQNDKLDVGLRTSDKYVYMSDIYIYI